MDNINTMNNKNEQNEVNKPNIERIYSQSDNYWRRNPHLEYENNEAKY